MEVLLLIINVHQGNNMMHEVIEALAAPFMVEAEEACNAGIKSADGRSLVPTTAL